ncbi:hypothetical protein [Dyella sp. C11]|uniref:bestrophin-like domain n=1 Tax=Dyella sp. C11 TaxID=2126991 RepID=UPI000D643085|nr:hypothetical protein [Dyella sp. C11]
MEFFDYPLAVFAATTVGLLIAHEAGFRLRRRDTHRSEGERNSELRDVRNQIALLLSLLLGFSMSMALNIYNARGQLVVDEANAIRTAFEQSRLMPRPMPMSVFQDYAKARIIALSEHPGTDARNAARQRSLAIRQQLLDDAQAQAHESASPIAGNYGMALSTMFNRAVEQRAANDQRIPVDMWALLMALSVLVVAIGAYGLPFRMGFTETMIILMIATSLALIADLTSPFSGFIDVGQDSLRGLLMMAEPAAH